MKRIATILLFACAGCAPDYEEQTRWRSEQQKARIENDERRRQQKVYALEGTRNNGRRAFEAGIPATANPETYDSYRTAWLDGYIQAAEAYRKRK